MAHGRMTAKTDAHTTKLAVLEVANVRGIANALERLEYSSSVVRVEAGNALGVLHDGHGRLECLELAQETLPSLTRRSIEVPHGCIAVFARLHVLGILLAELRAASPCNCKVR